jgi:hypothetical protein
MKARVGERAAAGGALGAWFAASLATLLFAAAAGPARATEPVAKPAAPAHRANGTNAPAAKPASATAAAPGTRSAASPAPSRPSGAAFVRPGIVLDSPYHGRPDLFAFGGHGEIRFGHDRVRGIENPEWLSFPRIEAFALARVHRRAQVVVDAAYDRVMDELSLERALLDVRVGASWSGHAGVMRAPLGRENREYDAPRAEFSDRSLVATDLVGAPVSMFGVGVHGIRGGAGRPALVYELDLVNGYDDGVVTEAGPGTRIASGRNVAGDNNGRPAAVGRIAFRPRPGREFGAALYVGQYNSTEVEGTTVDRARYLEMAVLDAETSLAGFTIAGEAGMAFVDIPPTLRAIYPANQWGAGLRVSRRLLAPILPKWRTSSLTAALRADAVDFDRAIPGDSKSRLTAALNIRPSDRAVIRGQWFYEITRDRFDNDTPSAGVAASGALYF